MDTQLQVITTAMLSCLCEAVSGNPNPPQHCCRRVEFEVPEDIGPFVDLCCEGLAYLALGDIWFSTASFPEQDIIRQVQGYCAPAAWAAQIKLGIMRCVPNSMNPTCAEEDTAFIQELHDAQALRSAACCIRDYFNTDPQWTGFNVVIERQTKTVQGGCMDRFVPITVQFPNCDC